MKKLSISVIGACLLSFLLSYSGTVEAGLSCVLPKEGVKKLGCTTMLKGEITNVSVSGLVACYIRDDNPSRGMLAKMCNMFKGKYFASDEELAQWQDANVTNQESKQVVADQNDLEKFKKKGKCEQCNLSGANLRNLNLRFSELAGADLTGADLSGSDFKRSDFRGANLTNAILLDTDVNGVNFKDAILVNIVLDDKTKETLKYARNLPPNLVPKKKSGGLCSTNLSQCESKLQNTKKMEEVYREKYETVYLKEKEYKKKIRELKKKGRDKAYYEQHYNDLLAEHGQLKKEYESLLEKEEDYKTQISELSNKEHSSQLTQMVEKSEGAAKSSGSGSMSGGQITLAQGTSGNEFVAPTSAEVKRAIQALDDPTEQETVYVLNLVQNHIFEECYKTAGVSGKTPKFFGPFVSDLEGAITSIGVIDQARSKQIRDLIRRGKSPKPVTKYFKDLTDAELNSQIDAMLRRLRSVAKEKGERACQYMERFWYGRMTGVLGFKLGGQWEIEKALLVNFIKDEHELLLYLLYGPYQDMKDCEQHRYITNRQMAEAKTLVATTNNTFIKMGLLTERRTDELWNMVSKGEYDSPILKESAVMRQFILSTKAQFGSNAVKDHQNCATFVEQLWTTAIVASLKREYFVGNKTYKKDF